MQGQAKKLLACAAMIAFFGSGQALAAGTETAAPRKAGGLSGCPVTIGIAGGAIAPKGKPLTVLNYSYRHKTHIDDGPDGSARTLSNEIWLLKLRYSPTDRVEFQLVPGFINNHLDSFKGQGEDHIYGANDFYLGGTYMFLSERFGDPVSAAVSFGFNLPTGGNGSSHPPGFDAWGAGGKIGLTKVWQPVHRFDTDLVYSQPLESGNMGVKRGSTLTWNGSYHYILSDTFDVGVEWILEHGGEGEDRLGRDMNNDYTEMYAGPAINYIFPKKWGMWFGAGMYFPVFRDVDQPRASENVRIELKLGKVWGI
ncbi:MAG: transporter [Desulfobulbus sp.]|jgi:hypothetical protein